MLVIRLNRTGKRNQASFRVVVQEHTKAPGHRHIEVVGSMNPHSKETVLKKDRILHWIAMGAQPSDTVHNLLIRKEVIEGKKIARKMARPVKKEEPVAEVAKTETESSPVEEKKEESPIAEVATEAVTPVAEETKEEAPVAA